MTRSGMGLALLAIMLLAVLPAAPARAQPTRTFVAAQGNDGNPCTYAAPCRTFQHAHDVVASGGEIDVLDPAGYGALTISKAISIQGHGYSGITATGGATAITITAGASDKINLRGLLLDGAGTGGTGVTFSSGGSLNIQESLIRNFASHGLALQPGAASTLAVSDSVIAHNGGAGIFVGVPGGGTATVALNRVDVVANNAGLSASGAGASNVMVRDALIGNNATTGILVNAANAVLRMAHCTISGNATGLQIASGVLHSYGDNNIDGNGTNGSPTDVISFH